MNSETKTSVNDETETGVNRETGVWVKQTIVNNETETRVCIMKQNVECEWWHRNQMQAEPLV